MAHFDEIKYFNSFWVKKTNNKHTTESSGGVSVLPVWPALPYKYYDNVEALTTGGSYPDWRTTDVITPGSNTANVDTYTTTYDWIIEESRIKGGYNNTSTDYGVKAYLVKDSNEAQVRPNSLIYSGILNSRTGVNETNVFSSGENIVRSANPVGGSIQKLHAEENNLIVLQENKSSRALIDKDTIYTSEGGTQTQAAGTVIGQIEPYAGVWGISNNPESFAFFGHRKYYVDKNRNAILRLSHDGITPISRYGMYDYFRDELQKIENDPFEYIVTGVLEGSQSPSFPYGPPPVAIGPGEPNFVLVGTTASWEAVEPGMCIFLQETATNAWINSNCYVKSVNTTNGTVKYFGIQDGSGSNGLLPNLGLYKSTMRFIKNVKDRITGGWDIYNNNYIVSLTQESNSDVTDPVYTTSVFDEEVLGWVSFYDYNPYFTSSIFSHFFTTTKTSIWRHNAPNVDRNSFYGTDSVDSVIVCIFNANVNSIKTFRTVSYEGSNGWEMDSFISDGTTAIKAPGIGWTNISDESLPIKSYTEGLYTESGVPRRAGFDLKENRYVANLVANNPVRPGEVIIESQPSGIKGFYATVRISSDATTNPGGCKELFSIASDYNVSN